MTRPKKEDHFPHPNLPALGAVPGLGKRFTLSPADLIRLGKSLSPSIIQPQQFHPSPLHKYKTRGEVLLMCAVLDAAISDFILQLMKKGSVLGV